MSQKIVMMFVRDNQFKKNEEKKTKKNITMKNTLYF